MGEYFQATRSPWYSYLFVLPLLVLYQVAAFVVNLGHRAAVVNGADALVQNVLAHVGLTGLLGSWLALAVISGAVVYQADAVHRKGKLRTEFFPPLLLECAVYALLFGTVVGTLTSLVLHRSGFLGIPGIPLEGGAAGIGWAQKLAVGLGAGLYEELIFRVLLMGGLIWLFRRAQLPKAVVASLAVVISSGLFSLFHHVGYYGEPFTVTAFAFRFTAGAVLALLFYARGFAVAAWTHSLYDVFLILSGGA